MNERQTILGANGTIGAVLAKELAAFTATIRLVSRNPRQVNGTDELLPADLTQPGEVERAVAGSAVVYLTVGLEYSLAVWQALWPRLMRDTLDACRRHNAKLVFFDNVYMYDKQTLAHMTEAAAVDPPSKKGAVRAEIAAMLQRDVEAGHLQALIARSADFYGPGNEKSFLIELVYKNLARGKRANWLVDAGRRHSFTFTPDAAKGTALLGNTAGAFNQVWHLPTDPNAPTGREMVALFAEQMGVGGGVSVIPRWMLRALGLFKPLMREMPEMMYQYDRDYVFDSSKFTARFGIGATSYQDGVKQIVAP